MKYLKMMKTEYDFTRKFSLLDTNILKEMTQKTKRSESFRPLFQFLKDKDISLFIIEPTRFELVGYNTNRSDFDKLNTWIGKFPSLPLTKEDISSATMLSSLYKSKNSSINPKQISFIDCLYAAQVIKYKGMAFIVTNDVNDYPNFLFDMPHYIPIEEMDGATSFVGFKTYNENKWVKLQENFNTSS